MYLPQSEAINIHNSGFAVLSQKLKAHNVSENLKKTKKLKLKKKKKDSEAKYGGAELF